jgi:hypothetical protein
MLRCRLGGRWGGLDAWVRRSSFFFLDLGESSRASKFAGYDVSDVDDAERRSVVEQRIACKEFHLTTQVSMS